MKKMISLTLALALLLGLPACGEAGTGSGTAKSVAETPAAVESGPPAREVASTAFPLYNGMEDSGVELTLYFLDGVEDLPYIEANDLPELLSVIYHDTVDYTLSAEGSIVTCSRYNELYETDVPMTIDFDRDVIRFADYNLFTMRADQYTMLDLTSIVVKKDDGAYELIEKIGSGALDRRGDAFELRPGEYGIDLVEADGKRLIPLQLFSDFLVAPIWLESLYFNGQCVIQTDDIVKKSNDLYYDAPGGERSQALAEYGYNELCLMLDTLYGLKENHGIESFDKLFTEVGFKDILKGPSVADADKALYRIITEYIDDVHSHWYGFSYLTGPINYAPLGTSRSRVMAAQERYKSARAKFYPQGVPAYEEVGDTAYITFDEFLAQFDTEPYYATEDPMDFSDRDTIGLIIKAHSQITREGSPIKNVVIDLSCNGGGDANAAEFTIAWFLGEGSIGMQDPMTGARCVSTYRADTNRDRVFDEKDTLGDRRLFCLTSPCSFSSGNLVPCMFKESGVVTLLGRTSAGGACVIQPISTAWGTSFRISGPRRLSFLKNGSFYDIDRGADPDFVITSPEGFYDRTALTEYINSLY